MGEKPFSNVDDLLDAYLDGALDAAERQRVDQRLTSDRGLRDRLHLQEQIDAALRRLFIAPSPQRTLDKLGLARAAAGRGRRSSLPRAAVAAAVILLLVGGNWFAWRYLNPREPEIGVPPVQLVSFDKGYEQIVAGGFRPLWLCRNNQELAGNVWKQFGQGLALKDAPREVRVSGLHYRPSLTPRTMVLMFRVDDPVADSPVIVFIDEKKSDSGPKLADGSGLNVFRGEVGGLVLYEVTPADQAHALPLFYDPKMPEQWYREGIGG